MDRYTFDALCESLEGKLTEYNFIQDIESFWTVVSCVTSHSADRILSISRKGQAEVCFWNALVSQTGIVACVETGASALTAAALCMEDRGHPTYLIMADPADHSTFLEAKKVLGAVPVDFLYIDGQTDYLTVKKDFEDYQTLVRPAGKICISNINDLDIKKFWEEIPYNKKSFSEGIGIGIVMF